MSKRRSRERGERDVGELRSPEDDTGERSGPWQTICSSGYSARHCRIRTRSCRASRRRPETRSTDSGVKKLQPDVNRRKTRYTRLSRLKSATSLPLASLAEKSQGPDLNRRIAALQAAA